MRGNSDGRAHFVGAVVGDYHCGRNVSFRVYFILRDYPVGFVSRRIVRSRVPSAVFVVGHNHCLLRSCRGLFSEKTSRILSLILYSRVRIFKKIRKKEQAQSGNKPRRDFHGLEKYFRFRHGSV